MNVSAHKYRPGQALLPLLAAAVIAALVGIAGWWYFASAPALPTEQAQAIVDKFLAQLRTGKTDEAWQATAADFKSYQGREAFRAYVSKHPELKQPLQFQTQAGDAASPLREFIYQGTAAKSKTPRTIKVRLVQEAAQWKVESLAVQ